MSNLIKQSIILPATAKQLYAMYLSPSAHAAFTGAPVKIGSKPGSPFSAFGGALSGTMIATVPGKLIVQNWRSTNFAASDPDSTLILMFTSVSSKNARIDLVHVNVPDVDYDGVKKGWPKYYWRPWRKALAKK